MAKRSTTKKLSRRRAIRPLRSEANYKIALAEIERYFEVEPKPGTSEADRFDLLARVIEDYGANVGQSNRLIPSKPSAGAWRPRATRRRISGASSARASEHPTFSHASVA
jgi:hypothetical protein